MKKTHTIVNIVFIIVITVIVVIQPASAQTPTPYNNDLNTFRQLMNILFAPGAGSIQQSTIDLTSPSPSSTFQPQDLSSTINPLPSSLTYYPQCDGLYDNVLLPNGCNLCEAGCGPTTVAMILSSYVDRKFTPDTVIDLYKQNRFYAGCDGTKVVDAINILTQNGLQTTSILYYDDNANNNDAIQDFKAYINNGWTIFVLGRFCLNGCRHYFWITNVDDNNNVWAYDPFYGRKQLPPYNENSRYPFPKYRLAFGIKK